MDSKSLLPRSQDHVENKFNIFGLVLQVKKIFWSELRWERKMNHIPKNINACGGHETSSRTEFSDLIILTP
jgi:hypothetical protein